MLRRRVGRRDRLVDAELEPGARRGDGQEVRGRQSRHQGQARDHRVGRPADAHPDGASLRLAARRHRGAARLGRALRAGRALDAARRRARRAATITCRPRSTTTPGTASCGAFPTASRRTASSTTRACSRRPGSIRTIRRRRGTELVDAAEEADATTISTASPSPAAASSATPSSARCPSSG